MHSIKNYKLILASASPRRQQLMKDAGFTFEVRLKNVEEKYPQELHWENVPEYLSKVKASAFREELKADEVLITADTVVCIHDRILGKPADRKEAISMLQELSGNLSPSGNGCERNHSYGTTFFLFTDRRVFQAFIK